MAFKRKKRSLGWHIEQKLDDAAMWHKKQIRWYRKKLNLTDYKLLWLTFAKGVLVGLILL
jgi:hypothetical protein|tara:strand:+ start:445 stop:624 length:180 start_codon:yes stop_codon:yes gene_type:complete